MYWASEYVGMLLAAFMSMMAQYLLMQSAYDQPALNCNLPYQ